MKSLKLTVNEQAQLQVQRRNSANAACWRSQKQNCLDFLQSMLEIVVEVSPTWYSNQAEYTDKIVAAIKAVNAIPNHPFN